MPRSPFIRVSAFPGSLWPRASEEPRTLSLRAREPVTLALLIPGVLSQAPSASAQACRSARDRARGGRTGPRSPSAQRNPKRSRPSSDPALPQGVASPLALPAADVNLPEQEAKAQRRRGRTARAETEAALVERARLGDTAVACDVCGRELNGASVEAVHFCLECGVVACTRTCCVMWEYKDREFALGSGCGVCQVCIRKAFFHLPRLGGLVFANMSLD